MERDPTATLMNPISSNQTPKEQIIDQFLRDNKEKLTHIALHAMGHLPRRPDFDEKALFAPIVHEIETRTGKEKEEFRIYYQLKWDEFLTDITHPKRKTVIVDEEAICHPSTTTRVKRKIRKKKKKIG